MAENTYDAHVHFGEPSSQQPYDKSTIYVNELNQLFDELALRERWFFPNPNVSDKRQEMNDYIAQCVQKNILIASWTLAEHTKEGKRRY